LLSKGIPTLEVQRVAF